MSNNALAISYGGYSTKGKKPENQDAFVAHQPDSGARYLKGCVACIADGVSCSDSAQLASQTSVTTFIEDYFSTPETWPVKTAVARVLSSLNAWLFHHGQQGRARHNGLVTTFSAVVLKSTTAHFFHIGDSRIYRFRANETSTDLELLTRDHTHHPSDNKTILTRALGMDSHLDVDYLQEDVQLGDVLLLTTDGVHDSLNSKELKLLLAKTAVKDKITEKVIEGGAEPTLEALSQSIVEAAFANGSADNLSCLLLRVDGLPVEDIDEVHRRLTHRMIPPVMDVGMNLDGYEVINVIHSGVRSHLYLVKQQASSTLLVMKAPSEYFAEDPQYLEGFMREQWVGRRIDNPGVMKILPATDSSPFLYHICEYVEGCTLRQWIYDNPTPPLEKVRALVSQIISALRAFQRLSMVHRDLKPENIMISPNGRVKIIDFGTVLVSGLEEIASPLEHDAVVGAVDYIAPEYLLAERAGHRSDIFSLGVIVYEMLTGALPYKRPLIQRTEVRSYDVWKYQSACKLRSDIPLWLDLALQKATAPKPVQRYSALSEFLHDLKVPNTSMVSRAETAPLLERNPLRFWKLVSCILFIALLVQALLYSFY